MKIRTRSHLKKYAQKRRKAFAREGRRRASNFAAFAWVFGDKPLGWESVKWCRRLRASRTGIVNRAEYRMMTASRSLPDAQLDLPVSGRRCTDCLGSLRVRRKRLVVGEGFPRRAAEHVHANDLCLFYFNLSNCLSTLWQNREDWFSE